MDEKVLNILQNIEKRLTDLEKNMNELSKKTVHSFHLDIENVQTKLGRTVLLFRAY
ncbi:hypothetical protein [Priestia sp. YIM B13489]|uniref:hypothetical protein n=1 Tax=Priestia sp. YIM B13489 TaxID=3366313 RepID=UPI00366FBEFD